MYSEDEINVKAQLIRQIFGEQRLKELLTKAQKMYIGKEESRQKLQVFATRGCVKDR